MGLAVLVVAGLAYWDAIEEVFDAFERGDIPADCRALSVAVSNLSEQAEAFHTRDDESNFYPKDKFWDAVKAVREATAGAVAPRKLIPLEPMTKLREQKVEDWQIAKIYGLVDADGIPQTHLVQKEIDKPGSVIDENWRDPRLKDIEQEQELAEGDDEGLERKTEAAKPKQCPESPRQLWEQKVSIQQAAKMLLMTEEEVAELFAQYDEERKQDSDDDPPATNSRERMRPPVRAAKQDSKPPRRSTAKAAAAAKA